MIKTNEKSCKTFRVDGTLEQTSRYRDLCRDLIFAQQKEKQLFAIFHAFLLILNG